ncbi:MAG: hypothetical protein ACKOFF_05980 [Acidimicrobiales bacterium]
MAQDDIDPEEIDDLEIEEDPELALEDDLEIEEEFDDDLGGDEDGDDTGATGKTVSRKAGEDDDEDEELLTDDDVEADLDKILKDKLASEDPAAEDEEQPEPDDRGNADDSLQPKRADELLCPSCFLLVRQGAPNCPVGDDACPVFNR